MHKEKNLLESLDYTPVASRFGTSGVRALVSELTDLEIYSLTLGTLRYLDATGKLGRGGGADPSLAIPLAGDLRPSTGRMLQATARAIMDGGHRVDYLGRIPTPALTYYALEQKVASFMITGSHIPADRNGQKANRCDGEVLKSDEQGIAAAVAAVRQEQYAHPAEASLFDPHGMLKPGQRPQLPPVNREAERRYAERYLAVFPAGCLHGKRIVFFEYAAVGRDLLPAILEDLGAEVVRAGRSDQFVPIDTEAISDAHLEMLSKIVMQERSRHGRIDAVVSTDGDSDRPLVVGVTEAASGGAVSLRFFPGDLLGILVADALQADAIAVPISANPAVHEYFQNRGLVTTKTRIGSPFVIQAMQEARAKGRRRVVAWEANGGFLVGSEIPFKQGVLRPLPTRDALLPMLCVLDAAAGQGGDLGVLFDRLPGWYGKAALIDDFSQQTSRRILAHFSLPDAQAVWLDFQPEGIVLRDLEEAVIGRWGPDTPQARNALAKKRQLERIFSAARGFGDILRINTQDGIRCFFSNGDIAHIRPSGNAPQLRIYAHARSQARANEIAALGVAEPDGMLRELQRLIEGEAR